jgi:hypothetical protein
VTGVALDAVQTAAVHRDDGALDIYQVVLAQVLVSFPLRNQCATSESAIARELALRARRSERPHRVLHPPGERRVILTVQ